MAKPILKVTRDADYPHGFVQCSECGAKYCSLAVYEATHKYPFKWEGDCGHVKLRWKQAPQGLWKRVLYRLGWYQPHIKGI